MKLVVCFSVLLVLVACVTPKSNKSNLKFSDTGLKILALGDSYTIGESVVREKSFPFQLAELLGKNQKVAEPKVIARTGWTTFDLLNAIQNEQPKQNEFDIVTLLIGVNNEFRGGDTSRYKPDFEQLLNLAISFAKKKNGKVVVVSIPDYGYTPYGESSKGRISKRIDAFNAVNKKIAQNANVFYVDITPISRKGLEQNGLVANDGLHPSSEMYKLWVDEIIKFLK